MKGVSEIVAALVVIVVVIVAGFGVWYIMNEYFETETPKGGVLTIASYDARYDPRTNDLWVTIRGYYEGSSPATITDVKLYADDAGSLSTISDITTYSGRTHIMPNSVFKIVLHTKASIPGNTLVVSITYCYSENRCSTVGEKIKVET